MKYPIYILILLTAILLTPSCVSSPFSNSLPPLKIKIPSEIQHNKEIVDFIENAENAINEYSVISEEMAEEYKDLQKKKEKDLTVFDKVKKVTLLGQYTENFSEFSEQYTKLMKQTEALKDGLNEEQKLALTTLVDTLENRMEQIEIKYKDLTTK